MRKMTVKDMLPHQKPRMGAIHISVTNLVMFSDHEQGYKSKGDKNNKKSCG